MSLIPFAELQELTDRKHPLEVIGWLRDHGWRFEVSAAGRPKVDFEEWRRHMIGGKTEKKKATPNLDWFNGQNTKAQQASA